MNQQTFTDLEYANRRETSKREQFLNTMDEIIPWKEWAEWIKPYYPSGKRGRKPRGIETMLRMYLLQYWYHLSTPATEDAVCDSYAMRLFLRIDFIDEQVPDASTLLRFHRILKSHQLDAKILNDLDTRLTERGFIVHRGNMEDAVVVKAAARRK